jgi:hypothetical protein
MKSEMMKIASSLIVFCTCSILAIGYGYTIENVDETWYPIVTTMIIVYIGVGDLVMLWKGLDAPATPKIEQGRLDIGWALNHYWWVVWWPKVMLRDRDL